MSVSSLKVSRMLLLLVLGLLASVLGGASVKWLIARAQSVGAGQSHSAVLETGGTIAIWGNNGYGQLGDGTNTQHLVPLELGGTYSAVSLGSNHTLALKSDGTVWAWGYNGYGQLGDGTTTGRTSAVQVNDLGGVVAIAAGDGHSVAVKSDGTVWAWGYNGYGQLGDGTTTNRQRPTQVPGVSTATIVSAGSSHTLIGTATGVLGVGYNGYGQLGDGTTTSRLSPVPVTAVPKPIALAAGLSHSMAVGTDGTVWAWGYNGYGMLGDGTTISRPTAVPLSTISAVSKIAASNHTLAVKTDGTVWSWGYNGYGQLGDGTTTSQSAPVQVQGITGAVAVAAGAYHSLAVTSNGTVYVWGSNSSGQLGDGTTVSSNSPKSIAGTNFGWKVGAPQFNYSEGTYNYTFSVTVTCATAGATIYYTLDGTTPTTSSPSVISGGTIAINQTQTLKAFALKTGNPSSDVTTAAYVLKVYTPSASPGASTYTAAQTVTLTDSTPGVSVRYTLDGSTPTSTSPVYSMPLSISTQTTIKAYGTKPGWADSDIYSGTYSFNYGTLASPTMSPAAGMYTGSISVTLTCAAGATARYTTDNTNPVDTSTSYASPIVLTTTTTLKAACFQADHATSTVLSTLYTLQVAAPTLSRASGSYAAGTTVNVTSPTSGATLYYTLDGTDPKTSSTTLPSGETLVLGNYTLKVKAVKAGALDSAIASATYSITGSFASFAVAAGTSTSYALSSDGTVWAWGGNEWGQLGDGTTTNQPLPRRVPGITGVKQLMAYYRSAYVIRDDGTVWGWGSFAYSPVRIEGLTQIVQVAAGILHGIALRSDGTVWTWGDNSVGELGDGTTINHPTPIQVPGLDGVTTVAAGYYDSSAVKGALLYAWGRNSSNELGIAANQPVLVPTLVPALVGVLDVRTVEDPLFVAYSLVLETDGSLSFLGIDYYGYVTGHAGYHASPIPILDSARAVDVSTARGVALSLAADGSVQSWGWNALGQLGDGTTNSRSSPQPIPGLPPVVSVATGGSHSLAITSRGEVYTWGYAPAGALGTGATVNALSPVGISGSGLDWRVSTPTLVPSSGTYTAPVTLTANCATPLAEVHFTSDGSEPTTSAPLWATGTSTTVQEPTTFKLKAFVPGLNESNTGTYVYSFAAALPTATPPGGNYSSTQVVSLSTSTPGASIRYTLDGSEPSSASTLYSQPISIGTLTTLKSAAFRDGWQTSDTRTETYSFNLGSLNAPVLSPASGTFQGHVDVSISSDPRGSLYYTTDGSEPTQSSRKYAGPIPIDITTSVKAKSLSPDFGSSPTSSGIYRVKVAVPVFDPAGDTYPAGQDVTISVATAGAGIVFQQGPPPLTKSAGSLRSGQSIPAGNFTLTAQGTKPGCDPSDLVSQTYSITGKLPDLGARVALGAGFGLFVDTGGRLYSWGENGSGQLGDGTRVSRRASQKIVPELQFRAVAAGQDHSVALARDGSLWTWGANSSGQLGLGDLEARLDPTLVSGLDSVVQISAGSGVTYALTADGVLWAWGRNDRGQLGGGAVGGTVLTPARVRISDAVALVVAGQQHALAITRSGALYSWGANSSGQLGDGTTADRAAPAKIAQPTVFQSAAAGENHSLAGTSDGAILAFGDNTRGELGTGSVGGNLTTPALSLVSSAGGPIAAGNAYSIVCSPGGSCVGFGANDTGQLGLATGDLALPMPILTLSGIMDLAAGRNAAAAVNSRGQLLQWGGVGKPLPLLDLAVARARTELPQPIITGFRFGQDYVWWGDDFTVSATNLDSLDPHLTVGQFPGYAIQATSVVPTSSGEYTATFRVPYDTRGGRFLALSSRGRTTPVDNNLAPINISPPVIYNNILSVVGTNFKRPSKAGHVFVSDADGVYDVDIFTQPFNASSNQRLANIPGGQLLSETTSDGRIFFAPTATGNPDVMALDMATGRATSWASTKNLSDKNGAKPAFTVGAIATLRDGSGVFIWDKTSKRIIFVTPGVAFFVLDEQKFFLTEDSPSMIVLNRGGYLLYNTPESVQLVGPLHGGAAAYPIRGVKSLFRGDAFFDNDPTQPNAWVYTQSHGATEAFNPATNRAAGILVNDARTRLLLHESTMWTSRVVTDRVTVMNPSPPTGPIPFLSDAQVQDGILSVRVVAAYWQTVSLRVIDPPDNAPYVQPQLTGLHGDDNKATSTPPGLGISPQGPFSRCLTLQPADVTTSGDTIYQAFLKVPDDSAAGDNFRIEVTMSPFTAAECSGAGLPDRPLMAYSGSIEVWRQIALEIDPMYRRGAPLARRASPKSSQVWLAKLNKNPGSPNPSFQEVDNLVEGDRVAVFGTSATGAENRDDACVDRRDPNPPGEGPDAVLVTLKDCVTGLPYEIKGDYLANYSATAKDLDFEILRRGISGIGATAPPTSSTGEFFEPSVDALIEAFAGAYVEFFPLDDGAGSRPLPYIDQQWFARNDQVAYGWLVVRSFKNYMTGLPRVDVTAAPNEDVPHNVWHIVGATSGLLDKKGRPAYALTTIGYDLTALGLAKMEQDAAGFGWKVDDLTAWVTAHEFGHHFNVNTCSGDHDDQRMAWTTKLGLTRDEVCLMRTQPPTPYSHLDLTHFCVEEMLLGDPACQGTGTSIAPRAGSIRGAPNAL